MSHGGTKPDCFTRRKADHGVDHTKLTHPELACPVLMVGEAKPARSGQDKNRTLGTPHYTTQMQAAVYPTLILLILLYVEGKRNRRGEVLANDVMEDGLSEEFFIYGIYYDERSVIIYAHLPCPIVVGDRVSWRFIQIMVKKFDVPRREEDPCVAARLCLNLTIALQVVREHGRRLDEIFQGPKYRDLCTRL